MATQDQKIHGIIHSASLSAAAVGAGMAQLPGADAPFLAGIQTTMIVAIGAVHDVRITEAEAAKILLPFIATVGGRGISQFLVGWIPGGLGVGVVFGLTLLGLGLYCRAPKS